MGRAQGGGARWRLNGMNGSVLIADAMDRLISTKNTRTASIGRRNALYAALKSLCCAATNLRFTRTVRKTGRRQAMTSEKENAQVKDRTDFLLEHLRQCGEFKCTECLYSLCVNTDLGEMYDCKYPGTLMNKGYKDRADVMRGCACPWFEPMAKAGQYVARRNAAQRLCGAHIPRRILLCCHISGKLRTNQSLVKICDSDAIINKNRKLDGIVWLPLIHFKISRNQPARLSL